MKRTVQIDQNGLFPFLSRIYLPDIIYCCISLQLFLTDCFSLRDVRILSQPLQRKIVLTFFAFEKNVILIQPNYFVPFEPIIVFFKYFLKSNLEYTVSSSGKFFRSILMTFHRVDKCQILIGTFLKKLIVELVFYFHTKAANQLTEFGSMSIVVFLTQADTLRIEIFRKKGETMFDPCRVKRWVEHEQIEIGMNFFNKEAIQFIFPTFYLFLNQFQAELSELKER